MPNIRSLYVLLVPLVVVACDSGKPSAPPPIFQLLPLAGASHSAVDSALGTPTDIARIRRIPEQMPGEVRDYALPGAPGPTTVRFFRGRAVFFTVYLPKPVETAQMALQRVGIEVGDAEPDTRAPLADWWRDGTLGGKSYVKVGALKNLSGVGEVFDVVQAEFR